MSSNAPEISSQSLAGAHISTLYDEPIAARACGAVDGKQYLNNEVALEHSLARGVKAIEVDVSLTADNKVVCSYGWFANARKILGLDWDPSQGPMTEAVFLKQKVHGQDPMTFETLYRYMKANPDVWWMLDFGKLGKENATHLANAVVEGLHKDKDLLARLLIQVRNASMYRGVDRAFHFSHYQIMMWPRERIDGIGRLITYCADYNIEGLAIEASQCTKEIVEMVRKAGLKLQCFAIDDAERANELLSYGVNSVCSFELSPADITPVPDPFADLTEEQRWEHLNKLRSTIGKERLAQRKTAISDEVVVEFDHVYKSYNLYKSDRERLLSLFWSKKKREGITRVDANNDLSFQIRRGEGVAFLGHNGAGKSTALKMITGVLFPNQGTVTVNGEVSALLELRAGFNSNLTGRENIYMRGYAMGLTEEQIKLMEPKVVEFADLGRYIDQPLRNYSSGMKARLGFGFAVSTDPEILVVDEALSVGDKKFKQKCMQRIRQIMADNDVTVLFVTHSSTAAREFCSRGIVLDHGTKMFDGTINEAIAFYEASQGLLAEGAKDSVKGEGK